tara:strand:- start:89 stop:394 length:306 start_codon:yes stop_codon:yes gene_type:complete
MKYLKTFLIIITFIVFNGCTDFRDAVTGQKKKTTDEFLIKKKDPLILPPNYDTLPIPKTKKSRDVNSSLESVISNAEVSTSNSETSSTLENMILRELRKKP